MEEDKNNTGEPFVDPPLTNAEDITTPVSNVIPETITTTEQNENMEVHHHPEAEKKGLKEYLLEGFMIFVAVTMGFIAENIRENISEKRIEKEYIESFVADLKQDTITFNQVIPLEETSEKGLDTMLHTISNAPCTDSSIKLMYYLYRKYTMSIKPMTYTLRTITQLKSSGGLRLIADKQASDSIVAYNKNVDDISSILNYTTHDFMIPSIQMSNKIFNPKFLLPYGGESIINLLKSNEKMSLLTSNESAIAEYTNLIYQAKQIRQDYLGQLKLHSEKAKSMILFFKKEYHLENE